MLLDLSVYADIILESVIDLYDCDQETLNNLDVNCYHYHASLSKAWRYDYPIF